MTSNILDGHMLRQIQGMPLKSVAVRKPRVGKADLFLADLCTTPTFQPLYVKIKKHSLRSNGKHPRSPGYSPSKYYVSTPAKRATKLVPFMFDNIVKSQILPLLSFRTRYEIQYFKVVMDTGLRRYDSLEYFLRGRHV